MAIKLLYRKLVEVQLLHDYYLPGTDPEAWPAGYDISNDLLVAPSPACAEALRNFHIRFLPTPLGFRLYAEAEQTNSDFRTRVPLDANARWSFFLFLRRPAFANFTNLPLREVEKCLFHFSNLTGTAASGKLYLNRALPTFGTTYHGAARYQLADLIIKEETAKRVWEAVVANIDPSGSFTEAQWRDTGVDDIHYVNPHDRLPRQGPALIYTRNNVQPGETVQFALLDARNQPVALGSSPGVESPQDTYVAPASAADPVSHTLWLGRLAPGRYALKVTAPSTVEPDRNFYLLDPMLASNAAGVIDLYAGGTPAAFALFDGTTQPGSTLIREKTYRIRFKNRVTRWQYLKQDGSQHLLTEYQPLSSVYSKITDGDGRVLPNPGVELIYPEPAGAAVIQNVFSKIFLDRTF